MMSKTLAVQMRLVRKINLKSLVNLRSLMVMLCILSVSVKAMCIPSTLGAATKLVGPLVRGPRHKNISEQRWEALRGANVRQKPRFWQFWQFIKGSFSFKGCLFVALLMIVAIFYPTGEGIIGNDSGASLMLRYAILIPGSALLAGAIFTSVKRFNMLKESANHDDYNHRVNSSKNATKTLILTNICMLIAAIVICSMAVPGEYFIKQAVGSVVVLSLFSVAGFVFAWHSNKTVNEYNKQLMKNEGIAKTGEGNMTITNFGEEEEPSRSSLRLNQPDGDAARAVSGVNPGDSNMSQLRRRLYEASRQ